MLKLVAQLLGKNSLRAVPEAYLIGAAGAGMKGLAEVLLDDGWSLSGVDQNADSPTANALTSRGMQLHTKHSANAISDGIELVIYSAAIPASNPERRRARDLGIPELSYVEAVSRITNKSQTVAVAGTHGKSSTTAWIVSLLESMQYEPTFFCGAQRSSDGRNGRLGQESLAIIEACEYRDHFHAFNPQTICLMGIERDHFDCFPDMEKMKASYRTFLQLLPPHGKLIYNSDCPNSCKLAGEVSTQKVSFSLSDKQAEWFIQRETDHVQVYQSGKSILTCSFQFPGQHHLMNLLAALATVDALNFDLKQQSITERIQSPIRLKRRFEVIETGPMGTIIDDYAHHPTEIKMTLNAARMQFPNCRIRCCFQPHQLSRSQALRSEFIEALSLADEVFLLPIFGAREKSDPEHVYESQRMVNILVEQGIQAMFLPSLDQVWRTLETDAKRQDILLTLGAGDITRIHNERTR